MRRLSPLRLPRLPPSAWLPRGVMTGLAPEKTHPQLSEEDQENGVTAMTRHAGHAMPSLVLQDFSVPATGVLSGRIAVMVVDLLGVLVRKDVVAPRLGRMPHAWATPPSGPSVMRWSMPRWRSTSWRFRPTERL